MSGKIVKWAMQDGTWVAEQQLQEEITPSICSMCLLQRESGDILVVGLRTELYYLNPETLEFTQNLESSHTSFVRQIVGLNKFKNEYFMTQESMATIKVYETDTGSCIISIPSTGFQINEHVANSMIELISPYTALFNSSTHLGYQEEPHEEEIFSSSQQTEMENEDTAMVAVSIPFKQGCAVAIYEIDPVNQSHKILKVLNRKGINIAKGFSLLQLKGGILAVSNFGEIEIFDIWSDFKLLKKSINSEDPIRKMILIEKRRRTNVLKEHPLGSYSLMSVGYRSELNLWDVDFKQTDELMDKAAASRQLQHKKSVLDVVQVGDQIITCSIDSSIHLYDVRYKY